MSRNAEIETSPKSVGENRSSPTGAQPAKRFSHHRPTDGTLVHRIVGMCGQARLLLLLPLMSAGQTWAYSGGAGALQVPYVIATAEDLIHLGQSPRDYDKHFILANDIDLAAYAFEKAVIAPESDNLGFRMEDASAFSGTLNGNGHVVKNLTITGTRNLGLVGLLHSRGAIHGLGVVNAKVVSEDNVAGILVGYCHGRITHCFSTGSVSGRAAVGGLVGELVGEHGWENIGHIGDSYSTAHVQGDKSFGGLAGSVRHPGTIANSFSAGSVEHTSHDVWSQPTGLHTSGSSGTTGSFWDAETSPGIQAYWDLGLSTLQMQDINTFLAVGWDFLGESVNGSSETWMMPAGGGYPVLTLFEDRDRLPNWDVCTLPADEGQQVMTAEDSLEAQWETVSLARIDHHFKTPSEQGLEQREVVLTISGNIHVLDGNQLVALSSDGSLACSGLDDSANTLSFTGVPLPLMTRVDCWTILPKKPLPFTLHIPLGTDLPLSTMLTEATFSVQAIYSQPTVTFEIPYASMTSPLELLPGFSVLVEQAQSENNQCNFRITETFPDLGPAYDRLLIEDSPVCGESPSILGGDLSRYRLFYNVTMVDTRGEPVSQRVSRAYIGSDMVIRTGVWTECKGIALVRYTLAVGPQRVTVPLTLREIPLPGI